jgi:hypothetical protein
MLAHQDYVNALSKVQRIIADISNRVERHDADILALNDQLVPQKQELARLSLTSSSGSDKQLLGQQVKDLEAKLAEFKLPPVQVANATSQDSLRHWRAAIQARLGQAQNRFNQLSELLKELGPLANSKLELEQRKLQLIEKEHSLAVADKARLETDEAQKFAEKGITEITGLLAAGQARTLAFQWHKANRPLYSQLLANQLALTKEQSDCSKLVETARSSEESAATELRKVESDEKQLSAQFDLKQETWKQFTSLSDSITVWQQNQKQMNELARQEAAIGKNLESIKVSESQHLQVLSKEQESENAI